MNPMLLAQHRVLLFPMTSYGETLMGRYLAVLIREIPERQVRPDWLQGLELDFYFPNSRLAFEFQGAQHFLSKEQAYRDRIKLAICRDRGIILVRVDAGDLFYHRLVRMIRIQFRIHNYPKNKRHIICHFSRESRTACRPLDVEATKYRHTLTSSFQCPTVHRIGTHIRRVATAEARRRLSAA